MILKWEKMNKCILQFISNVLCLKNRQKRGEKEMANKNYEEIARDIIENIGGEENVTGLRHCITRLRFNLKDESKANTDYLKKRDGVVTVVQSGDNIKSLLVMM